MLSNDELVRAVYFGNCRKLEKDFVQEGDSPSSLLLNMDCLQDKRIDGEYLIDFVSLILLGEAFSRHPHQSWKYKRLLDWVVQKDGLKKVIELTKHPTFVRDTQRIQLVKGGQIQPGEKKRIDVPVSNEMAIYIKTLEERYMIESIYNGDLRAFQECLAATKTKPAVLSDMCFDIVHLVKTRQKATLLNSCKISLVPLILKGEHDHPGHFLEYQQILDFVADKDGDQKVKLAAQNPTLSKIYHDISGIKTRHVAIPVSDQMRSYLPRLKKHPEEIKISPFLLGRGPIQK